MIEAGNPGIEPAGVRHKQVTGVGFQGGCGDDEELWC